MATRRMILKDDVESTKWPKLNFRQRYLYWGLTLYADDDGVILKRLMNRFILEEDEITKEEVKGDLEKLESTGLIYMYLSTDETMYIQILCWFDKQFIDKKMYKPTQLATSKYHLRRPSELQKGIRPSLYDSSRIPLEQNKKEEDRGNESNLEENNKKETSHLSEEDENLPF